MTMRRPSAPPQRPDSERGAATSSTQIATAALAILILTATIIGLGLTLDDDQPPAEPDSYWITDNGG
ncbi:MAG: hypothetical protein AAGA37_08545 [Actinomycetota bacterium]